MLEQHDNHHIGDFTITGDADDPAGLTFTTRSGFPIRPGPTFESPAPSPVWPPPTQTYRGPSGETLNLRYVSFYEPAGTYNDAPDPAIITFAACAETLAAGEATRPRKVG